MHERRPNSSRLFLLCRCAARSGRVLIDQEIISCFALYRQVIETASRLLTMRSTVIRSRRHGRLTGLGRARMLSLRRFGLADFGNWSVQLVGSDAVGAHA